MIEKKKRDRKRLYCLRFLEALTFLSSHVDCCEILLKRMDGIRCEFRSQKIKKTLSHRKMR